jgi:hypothetical protein
MKNKWERRLEGRKKRQDINIYFEIALEKRLRGN